MRETVVQTTPGPTFSQALREASWSLHGSAQHSPYMSDLFAGTLDPQRYIRMVGQHYAIYRALERAAVPMRDDPVAKPFVRDELARVPALFADLYTFGGADWESLIEPIDITQKYCEQIESASRGWAGGFIAHHYVRYLGDLSGGLDIRDRVLQTLGFGRDSGAAFYYFDGITDPDGFKREYRELLNQAPWDTEEQQRIIAEILHAYEINTELLSAI